MEVLKCNKVSLNGVTEGAFHSATYKMSNTNWTPEVAEAAEDKELPRLSTCQVNLGKTKKKNVEEPRDKLAQMSARDTPPFTAEEAQ